MGGLPGLSIQGDDAFLLIVNVATAVGGVWLLSASFIGFFFRLLAPAIRVLFGAAGILLLVPQEIAPGFIWTDIAGLALAIPLLASDYAAARKMRG